jgi:hypothetical protein
VHRQLSVALLRFRAAAVRSGESLDALSDAELLEGLGWIVVDDTIEYSALLAAGIERVGQDWPVLLEEARSRFVGRSERAGRGWWLRRFLPWRAERPRR